MGSSTCEERGRVRQTMEINSSDVKMLKKHEAILDNQEKAVMEEKYRRKMMHQKEMLSTEQEEMMKKQKLISLQIEMLQNELKQAQLMKKLEDTKEIISNLARSSESKETEEPKSLTSCNYYHGPISWQDSSELLQGCEEGTFLLRDSQDPHFLYTLSFQRGAEEGPTSVRLGYGKEGWRLDSHQHIQHLMPSFPSIVELVQYYRLLCSTSTGYPVRITTPLPRGRR